MTGWVAKANCSELVYMGLIPARCWNPLQPLGHFAWHCARQCTGMCTFILLHWLHWVCALFMFFPWISSVANYTGNLTLTGFQLLTWTSEFRWFGALGTKPWARTSDYSYCIMIASEQKPQQGLAIAFLEWSKILEIQWPTLRAF